MKRDKNAYNSFVCPFCFRRLDECICEYFPPWSLLFIDEGMQYIIRVLNEKGYFTSGCCESHYKENPNLHICFRRVYDFAVQPPEGRAKGKKGSGDILYIIPSKSEEEFERNKREKLKALEQWVDALPSIKRTS